MPAKSPAQERLMQAAAHTPGGYDGVPQSVGKEFIKADEAPEVNELTVAKAIRDNELASPQQYENIWLFDVRITGTGTSYRSTGDEYVYRPPEDFLSDEFLERCNGLPLIFEHPENAILNTKEFRDRSIGVVFLPYIKGDEVWGIAKVFDDDAAELMKTTHASTSPTVVFRNPESTELIEMDDGKKILIEGKPSYLDHLAICANGVWDKGGDPSGVANQTNEVKDMNEDEKVPAWADALMKRMDSIEDAKEKARANSEEEEKAKAKADEEDKKEEEAKADSEEDAKKKEEDKAKADSEEESKKYADSVKAENAKMAESLKAMQAKFDAMTKPMSASDRDALASAQAKADSVAQMFGDAASQPLHGESPIEYRKRLAEKFKSHSSAFKGVDLAGIHGDAFEAIEARIYADASSAALSPEALPAGRLIAIKSRDQSGREITRYQGDPDGWMNAFKATGAVVKFNRFKGE